MTPSPRERLAGALAVQTNLGDVAKRAGVSPRELVNAINARPVNTIAFLRIAAAIGFDPCPELPHDLAVPADFSFDFFGMGLFMRRGLSKHSDREAAKFIGVAPSTICRIERGDTVSIGVVLRACAYIGLSPFSYLISAIKQQNTKGNVSRETSPSSKQEEQTKQEAI